MVVHAGQVEALQADAGHPVLDLLCPQLRRLLLLLDEPADGGGRRRMEAALNFQARPASALSAEDAGIPAGCCGKLIKGLNKQIQKG